MGHFVWVGQLFWKDSESLLVLCNYGDTVSLNLDIFPPERDILMGEGFILLTRGYRFMGGGVPPPFWHVKNWYFYWWYKVETLQVVRLAFLV